MRQVCSHGLRPAAIDAVAALAALAARREGVPVNVAWAPSGYEATDIRVLEWIAAHRRRRHAKAILAA
jgi:hypothetical protein